MQSLKEFWHGAKACTLLLSVTTYLWVTHFHILFICEDPEVVQRFFGYIKGEIAYAINKLIGKRGPVWQNRTDTPMVIGIDKVVDLIVYLYSNPQSAGLVDRIEDYPGVSSWNAFVEGNHTKKVAWIKTAMLEKINRSSFEARDKDKLLDTIKKKDLQYHELKIDPMAWLKFYDEDGECEEREIVRDIIRELREKEKEIRKERTGEPIGAKALQNKSMHKWSRPKSFGRRVMVICSDPEYRREFISLYKSFVNECKEIYQKWKNGDFSVFFPPGAFPPPVPRLASAIDYY